MPHDDSPLRVVRGLAHECGLRRLYNGYNEDCFSYRDPNNKLWFVTVPETDVLIQLHQIIIVVEDHKMTNRAVFHDKYQISLYEPASISALRKIFWKLRFGLL